MERIENHPILGETPKRKKVTFSYDGKLLEGYEGEPIAAALKAGVLWFTDIRRKNMTERHFLCNRQVPDCVMIVDGKPNIRTSLHLLKQEWLCRHSMVFRQNPMHKLSGY